MSLKKRIGRKLNALVRRSYWFNEVLFPDCKKFWQYNTFNTDVINLGSTSSFYAFNYDGLPVKGGNWALRHNPLSGDRAILKNYFGYLNPEKSTVLISLCVFSSLSGSYDFMEDRFYTLVYPTSIPHFSYRRQQQIRYLVASPIRSFPLLGLFSEIKHILRGDSSHVLNEQEMQLDADNWIQGWLHEFSISDISAPLSLINQDGLKDAVYILNDIIFFCKERNINPILVLPPMYHTLAERFTVESRTNMLENLVDSIQDKSVIFLNYMNDSSFSHDRSLFRNSFLLNEKGAKLFTEKVLKDIGIYSSF